MKKCCLLAIAAIVLTIMTAGCSCGCGQTREEKRKEVEKIFGAQTGKVTPSKGDTTKPGEKKTGGKTEMKIIDRKDPDENF